MLDVKLLAPQNALGLGQLSHEIEERAMRRVLLSLATLLICGGSLASSAWAGATSEHTIIAPEEMKWGAGPAALPPGAEAVVLYGDPSKEGLFAMRIKVPRGYRIPPHSHSKPENSEQI